MLATDTCVEKSFELWPGVLRLVASGPDAYAAIDAGIDAARETAASLIADAEIVVRGSLDMLPRGVAARAVPEVARSVMDALGASRMPPLLVALPGAVCDVVLTAMRSASPLDIGLVTLGDTLAFHLDAGAVMPALPAMPHVIGEFVRALGSGAEGGAALAGLGHFFPTAGVADGVVVQGKSAAVAAYLAASIADSMTLPATKHRRTRIADPLVARAWEGREIADAPGLIPPEEIWEALSKGMKRAAGLREKRLLRAAAFALKGRGRTLGPIDGDRLVRFGVSEWR
ncbi:MAG: hypothetical protein WA943_15910 [Parvibaculum sp.]|uniref:hypothetical protein n=1 Tax=Parvibaculum sp. TaxID=2024848 RepID=UPI003C78FC5B